MTLLKFPVQALLLQAFDQIQSFLKLSLMSLDGSFFFTFCSTLLILSGSLLINFLLFFSPYRSSNTEQF